MNTISEFFYMGGTLFMSLISLPFFTALGFAIVVAIALINKKPISPQIRQTILPGILFFGSLAFVLGVLGQIIGLYSAFIGIEQMGEVSQAMLASGLKVSSITTLYGFLALIISSICWFALRSIIVQRQVVTA